jgi:hypothetical protein
MVRYELIEHDGMHASRLQHASSFRESIFAESWKDENPDLLQIRCTNPTLASLLGRVPTQDEATAVATVIQWLGSNCGQGFLHTVNAEISRHKEATVPA